MIQLSFTRWFASIIAAGVFSVLASPANAVVATGASGYPGVASAPTAVVYQAEFDLQTWLVSQARTVYESTTYRNYDQWVCVKHRLWFYNESSYTYYPVLYVIPAHWSAQPVNFDYTCAWIRAANSSAPVTGIKFPVALGITYGVDVVVTWALSDGTVIGKRTYDYRSASDYVCGPCRKQDTEIGAYVFIY